MSKEANEIINNEKNPLPLRYSRFVKIGIFFSTIGSIIFIVAFSYGYFQLASVDHALAQMVSKLQNQITTDRHEMATLQQTMTDLQTALQKASSLSTQQERMIADWKAAQSGNLKAWYLAEAQYLVRLANDHLQFTHDMMLAITLLKRADQTLENVSDPDVLEIRKSITNDLATLEALPSVDITSLYLQLTALNNQMDQLPLPPNPLNEKSMVSKTPDMQDATWWQKGWQRFWQALQQLVVVRYNGANALPLILPDEKTFLYQNLHAQIESAMWGVLNRNASVYQASLIRSMTWIQQYFVQDAPLTKNVLEQIKTLLEQNIAPPIKDLSATLQLFDNYFKQTNKAA